MSAAAQPIEVVIVAAVAENGVIGRDNEMPWRLKSDLRRFRALTWGRPVVMGRKTLLSIGRPLPGRTNIVVSRDADFARAGALVAPSVETALALAKADAARRGAAEIMVIGGAEIYRLLLSQADRLEITHVHAAPEGDASFPDIDPAVWWLAGEEIPPQGAEDSAAVSFRSYRRKTAS